MKFQRIFKKHNVKQPGKQLILVKHFFSTDDSQGWQSWPYSDCFFVSLGCSLLPGKTSQIRVTGVCS